jgi:hypothetical protein
VTVTAIDDDGGIDKQTCGFDAARTMAAIGSSKHQACPPTNHFEKLPEETCPNHTYPIKYRLRDYGLMKSFMTSGSLPWSMEVNDALDEGDSTTFLREDKVMTIYDACPSPGMRRISDPNLETLARCTWGSGSAKM